MLWDGGFVNNARGRAGGSGRGRPGPAFGFVREVTPRRRDRLTPALTPGARLHRPRPSSPPPGVRVAGRRGVLGRGGGGSLRWWSRRRSRPGGGGGGGGRGR